MLSQLVADCFGSRPRIINWKNSTAGALSEIIDDLSGLRHVATNRSARSISRLNAIDRNVQRLQRAQRLRELRFAAAIETITDHHDGAFLSRQRLQGISDDRH